MDSARWRRITAIFERAVELAPAGRAALLEHECAGDAELRREVEAMLAADATGDTFDRHAQDLRGSAAADWVEWNSSDRTPASFDGHTIGPWRVVRELGRGGMGLVFLVERADGQFEQLAALKLIKRGMDSDAVLARFLRERQILARLEHRNIARLLDGGLIPDGRPYFVMEYVDGVPISQYCAEHGSDLAERLRLFFGVCAAVQFAHRQLVVHSDLKPSNVLVGANGDVKLLDFGIAKLLGSEGAAATQTSNRPLTPAYAAPEQIRGEPLTTATDVYALGCLLYELLTGHRPFRLHDEPSLEQLRQVLDSTGPVAPSHLRAADAPVPPQRLRGDLDTIVLKALKREPDRRYATVDALAEDLKRFLAGLPIAAHRDSNLYRARKFVARHWLATTMTALAVLALSAAIAVAAWQAREKAAEARASSEVAGFLVGLFAASDPTHTRGAIVSAKDLLDQGAAQLDQPRLANPLLRARFLHAIATSYASLGLYDRALPLAEQALALRREHLSADDLAVAESMDGLGQIHAFTANYDAAEPLLRGALATRREHLSKDDPAVIESLGHLGNLLQDRGEFEAADEPFREALDRAERRYGAGAVETARSLDDYATNLQNIGKPVDAEAMYRRALAIRERQLGADNPDVASSLHNLGVILTTAGKYVEAEDVLRRALAIRRKVYGDAHPLVGFTELELASVLESRRDLDASEASAQRALAILRGSLDESHRKISDTLNLLAILRVDRRAYDDAVTLFGEVAQRHRRALGADHPDTLVTEDNLATSLYYAGRFSEAEALQRELTTKFRGDAGSGANVKNLQHLARTLEQQGKGSEAMEVARRALELQRELTGEQSRPYALVLRELALAEFFGGESDKAEAHYRESVALVERLAATGGFGSYGWKIPFADFLVGAGRCDEATPLLHAAAQEMDKADNANPIWRPQANLLLGACLQRSGRSAEAKPLIAGARTALQALPAIERDLYPTARREYAAGGDRVAAAPKRD
ncbi:serine/threonine-protein kinase [Dokdonella sp.]|uniref:serine/threonine-protein kinase n=1 Tax=Dokdonella sp. TaxID=2291710 RepID=UPI001B2C54DA|nr:serine/threonine-protein kinase [Dokdonella sp.]MBO9661866.1 serine/threonine protein kinase [Dokdonella sp.]